MTCSFVCISLHVFWSNCSNEVLSYVYNYNLRNAVIDTVCTIVIDFWRVELWCSIFFIENITGFEWEQWHMGLSVTPSVLSCRAPFLTCRQSWSRSSRTTGRTVVTTRSRRRRRCRSSSSRAAETAEAAVGVADSAPGEDSVDGAAVEDEATGAEATVAAGAVATAGVRAAAVDRRVTSTDGHQTLYCSRDQWTCTGLMLCAKFVNTF